jgi:hypothetical protein
MQSLGTKQTEALMVDNSFSRSRLYFRLLQLLRISSVMVREGKEETIYRSSPTSLQFPKSAESRTVISENWDRIKGLAEAAEARFQDRITAQTEEIKSLRDGVRLLNISPG